MDFQNTVIEPAKYAIIEVEGESLPATMPTLVELESRLEIAWLETAEAADKLMGLFNQLGACLVAIRGSERAYAPYKQSGFETWQAYVEGVLQPRLGISYVRATQIVKAYESKEEILDTLSNVERSMAAQLIAARFNAALPRTIPAEEAPLRALAGLDPIEKTAVLGIAEKINGGKPRSTYTDVKRAKAIHHAVKNGVVKLENSDSLTVEAVDKALLYDKILRECKSLPTEALMQLQSDIADEIVRRSTNEQDYYQTDESDSQEDWNEV